MGVDTYAPVGDEVVKMNPDVEADPSLVNTDPYGNGWIFKLKVPKLMTLETALSACPA